MAGLVLLLHFGTFQIVALMWQAAGVNAKPIMSAPLRATSLAEFWGKRWNLGFRQLGYELIFRPLHRVLGVELAGLLVFLVSGLIHDLVISVPARGGYGLPTGYFLLQGAGITIEHSPGVNASVLRKERAAGCLWQSLLRRWCSAVSSLVRNAGDSSFYAGNSRPMMNSFFNHDMWLCGIGHFVILFASFQVPYRLRWRQDLQSLMPFNRKLLWGQGGFTVLTILAFGTLTLVLHRELLRGDRAALALACFIGFYWTARILVDSFYFSHEDWPKGKDVRRGAYLADAFVSFSCNELPRPVCLAGVVQGQ